MTEPLTVSDIGCWVLKTRTAPAGIEPDWEPGTSRVLTRCVRRSYRVELMAPGQACLLWLSGRVDPGVQAIGALTSGAESPEAMDPSRREVAVTVWLYRLARPVPRLTLLADEVFSGAEVLRMPAGSNPSYLSPERLTALVDHLSPADPVHGGWATDQ